MNSGVEYSVIITTVLFDYETMLSEHPPSGLLNEARTLGEVESDHEIKACKARVALEVPQETVVVGLLNH